MRIFIKIWVIQPQKLKHSSIEIIQAPHLSSCGCGDRAEMLLEFLESQQYSRFVSYGNVFPVHAKIHSGNKNLLGDKNMEYLWYSMIQLRDVRHFIHQYSTLSTELRFAIFILRNRKWTESCLLEGLQFLQNQVWVSGNICCRFLQHPDS